MSKSFRRLSHSIYECKYHLVFRAKYRRAVLKDEIREYARREISDPLRQKEGIEIIEMNVQSDHIRLIAQMPPKYAVSAIMRHLKGKSAIRLLQKYEQSGERFRGRHLWRRGYCVGTVGLDETRIRGHVKWQENREKEIERLQGNVFDEE